MKLSVIIVNYNVKYFLEQVLLSVRKAVQGIDSEVIVVDNNSKDGSADLVREKFPEVHLIANTKNTGFSVANNQGIRISKGKYVLLLNPDIVVQEDTFHKSLNFMEEHPEAGALGVKMYDGKGNFLPESKRGLPTPFVAFCKIFGLSSLFPHSKTFNWYYMGHLDAEKIQEIEILTGAFILMQKSVLERIGYLDETFFMYGEDIDLSYRIIQAGYKNYYFPHTKIIHYKGESTKKGSLNYVRLFYNAMIIFAQKHFSTEQARFYTWFIQLAVYLRASLAIWGHFFKKMFLPFSDALLIFLGMFWIKNFWEMSVKAELNYYPIKYIFVNIPIYISIWISSIFLNGGYDLPIKITKLLRGILVGTVLISAVYGFLPESLRFSRGMILMGAAWSVLALTTWRFCYHFLKYRQWSLGNNSKKRAVIIGGIEEKNRAKTLINQANVHLDLLGYILPNESDSQNTSTVETDCLGYFNQLKEIVDTYKLSELIFCAKDLSNQQIIDVMVKMKGELNFKIIPENSWSIIGSNSKNTAGDFYALDINLNINKIENRRNKRLLDSLLAIIFLLVSFVLMFGIKPNDNFLKNCIQVLFGKCSWVGYATVENHNKKLPILKKGILSPLSSLKKKTYDEATINRLNLLYVKDYSIANDLYIIWKGFRDLGK